MCLINVSKTLQMYIIKPYLLDILVQFFFKTCLLSLVKVQRFFNFGRNNLVHRLMSKHKKY